MPDPIVGKFEVSFIGLSDFFKTAVLKLDLV